MFLWGGQVPSGRCGSGVPRHRRLLWRMGGLLLRRRLLLPVVRAGGGSCGGEVLRLLALLLRLDGLVGVLLLGWLRLCQLRGWQVSGLVQGLL